LLFGAPALEAQPSCDAYPAVASPFAPGLADTGRVFGGALADGGATLYYFLKQMQRPQEEDYRIVRSRRDAAGRWSPPEQLSLGGEHSDMYPTLGADGSVLVFSSYRRAPGDTSRKPNASLWAARRQGTDWGAPTPISAAARPGFYHSQVRLDPSGNLHFRRTTPDWRETESLVARALSGGEGAFGAPVRWDAVHRWTSADVSGRVVGGWPVPGDSVVILEVTPRDPATGRPGFAELWATRRTPNGYSRPAPLGAGVNSRDAHHTFAFTSADGCALFFVRGFSRFHQVRLEAALPK